MQAQETCKETSLNFAVYAKQLEQPKLYVMCWAFDTLETARWFCRNRGDVGRLELRRRWRDQQGDLQEVFLEAFHETYN